MAALLSLPSSTPAAAALWLSSPFKVDLPPPPSPHSSASSFSHVSLLTPSSSGAGKRAATPAWLPFGVPFLGWNRPPRRAEETCCSVQGFGCGFCARRVLVFPRRPVSAQQPHPAARVAEEGQEEGERPRRRARRQLRVWHEGPEVAVGPRRAQGVRRRADAALSPHTQAPWDCRR